MTVSSGCDSVRRAVRQALVNGPTVDLTWLIDAQSEWSMAHDTLQFVFSLIGQLRPQHVLEFGGGVSTHVLARAAARSSPGCRISSVDHDPEFQRLLAAEMVRDGYSSRVAVQLAPIVAREWAGQWLPTYHLRVDAFASHRPPDLILIDGPPTALGGRGAMLYQAIDLARRGTLVLLDDADRPAEQQALEHWGENLGDAVEIDVLPGFRKGLAAILVHRPIPRSALWEHRLRLSLKDLKGLAGPDDLILLVDEDQWRADPAMATLACLPFPERNGRYAGPPADDETAIREFEEERRAGARLIAFGWPAFWWFDTYRGLHEMLRSRYRCVLDNQRLVVFDLLSSV